MKKGLVMQGGAMRGLFTCGVIDVFMENGIEFDGAMGVSAGAVFGCNYKSKQIDRAHRYNINLAGDPRVGSIKSWLKTGNVYDTEFCYTTIPFEVDLFDVKTYHDNPMEFYVGCTNVETGKPHYQSCPNGDQKDVDWLRASASMPLVSKIVEIDGLKLLDGGASDSIPIKYFQSLGYNRNIVIQTREYDYYEKPTAYLPLYKIVYRKYPNLINSLKNHYKFYNETTEYLKELEKKGEIIVIRPDSDLKIKKMEHDKDKLNAVYKHGREVAERYLEKVKEFLKD